VGAPVALANVGTPGMALYAPEGGALAVQYVAGGGSGSGGGGADHVHAEYLTQSQAAQLFVPLGRQITTAATSGLAGGGALGTDLALSLSSYAAGAGLAFDNNQLSVVPGEGLELEGDALGLAATVAGLGLTYNAGVINAAVANTGAAGLTVEADAIRLTSSSNPGQSAKVLASDADGKTILRLLGLGLGKVLTDSTVQMRNAADSAYQALDAKRFRNEDGVYLTPAGAHAFTDHLGALAPARAASLLASSDPAHSSRVPANGIYALKAIRSDEKLTTPLIDSLTGADMTIAPGGDLYLSPVGNDIVASDTAALRSSNFLKTILTAGYRIGPTQLAGQFGVQAGSGEFDELRARVFVADETRVDRGQWYLTRSYGILSRAFTVPTTINGTAYLYVENSPNVAGALFTAGDWVMFGYLQIDTGIILTKIWGQVTSYNVTGLTGEQRWTFTLKRGEPANPEKPYVFPKGAATFDFGQSGQGYILMDAVTATAPSIQVGRWTTNPYESANYQVLTGMGRLDGLGFTGEYGLAASVDKYTTADQWIKVGTSGAQLNNLPLQFRYNGVQTVNWDADGSLWAGRVDDKKWEFDAATGQMRLSNSLLLGNGIGFATDALLYCAFDAGDPRYGGSGSANGHLGQPAALVGSPQFRPGRFGGALEATRAYTNLLGNSSFEAGSQGAGTNAVGAEPAGWSAYTNAMVAGAGAVLGTTLVSNLASYDGRQCLRIVKDDGTGQTPATVAAGRIGRFRAVAVTAGVTYAVSAWVRLGSLTSPTAGQNYAFLYATSGNQVTVGTAAQDGWRELKFKITAATSTLSVYAWLANCDAGELYVDAVQVTPVAHYPYWPSEAGARPASHITFGPLAGFDWQRFTAAIWFKLADTASSHSTNLRLFEIGRGFNRVNVGIVTPSNLPSTSYIAQNAAGTGQLVFYAAGISPITPDVWHHAAVTMAYPTLTLWIDGAPVGTAAVGRPASGTPGAVYVGTYSGETEQTCGWLDDFAVIPRALTAGEMAQIAQGAAPIRALASASELMLSNVDASGGLRTVYAHSGGLFGRVLSPAGAESASFALINDDSLSEWGGIPNPRTGDVIIGDSRSGGAYLNYDASSKTMTVRAILTVLGGNAATTDDLATKASTTYVDTGLAGKASTAALASGLSGKVNVGEAADDINGGFTTIDGGMISATSALSIGASRNWQTAGIQLQYNGGNPRAYIGNAAQTRYFKYEGGLVTWKAANTELDATGSLIASNATLNSAVIGNVKTDLNGVHIEPPAAFDLARGYKFRTAAGDSPANTIVGGLTMVRTGTGLVADLLSNANVQSNTFTPILSNMNATMELGAAAGGTGAAESDIKAVHGSAGVAGVFVTAQTGLTRVRFLGSQLLYDTNPIWHSGGAGHRADGSGYNADMLDGYHAGDFALAGNYAPLTNPAFVGMVKIAYSVSWPTLAAGEAGMFVHRYVDPVSGNTKDRFVIAYNHSGTTKYRWIDLDGAVPSAPAGTVVWYGSTDQGEVNN